MGSNPTLSAINVTLTRRRGIVGGRAGLSFKSSALSAFNVRYACKHLSIARRRALKLGDVIPQLLFASTHLNSHIGVFGSDKKSPNGGCRYAVAESINFTPPPMSSARQSQATGVYGSGFLGGYPPSRYANQLPHCPMVQLPDGSRSY